MKNLMLNTVLLGVLAIGFTGCVTSHQVRVDALSTGEGRGGSYELASATPGVEESDLFFKEVARFLEPVLASKRLYPAKEGEQADLLIEVNAHLSDPMTESETYSEPIYMETRGHYRPVRVPVVNSEGQVVRYTYTGYWSPGHFYNAGWVDNQRQITVYDKVLKLNARRILEGNQLSEEVWAVTISLRSESTDYRSSLPYMLVAAEPYIGGRTEGEEIIRIKLDSEDVEAFRASLSNAR